MSAHTAIVHSQAPSLSSHNSGLYLQYGCGLCAPDGWLNFDASWTLRFERLPVVGRLYTKNATPFPKSVRYGDIVKGLNLPQESCSGIYASHVLEHLAYQDCRTALRNTNRLLKRDGLFRLVVPDLQNAAERYVEALRLDSSDAGPTFLDVTGLGRRSRSHSWASLIYSWLASSAHLWMWDYPAMKHELREAGFRNIRKCAAGDSRDPMFSLVEDPARFENALAIEARK